MAEHVPRFSSCSSFHDFRNAVRSQRRYLLDGNHVHFLKAVAATAKKRVNILHAQSILWRAQVGCDWEPVYQSHSEEESPEHVADEARPFGPERMTPKSDCATEGRANPKGIPVLYCSLSRATAVAEVRPWVGSIVSVAQFSTTRELRLVNCSDNRDPDYSAGRVLDYMFNEPDPSVRETMTWHLIDDAFATPVTPSDEHADYVHTQIIAELFRTEGFDGVLFNSSVGDDRNVVLFDAGAAEHVECHLVRIKTLTTVFENMEQEFR